jgi:hypothetical protein
VNSVKRQAGPGHWRDPRRGRAQQGAVSILQPLAGSPRAHAPATETTSCLQVMAWHGSQPVDDTASGSPPWEHQFDSQELAALGSGAIQPKQGVRMLTAIDRLTSFSEVWLSTTDGKMKVRVNKCSACSALVHPNETRQHRRFHDELRELVRQVDLAR